MPFISFFFSLIVHGRSVVDTFVDPFFRDGILKLFENFELEKYLISLQVVSVNFEF